jgi:predicted enzyme related to lactoylglutathione lyase
VGWHVLNTSDAPRARTSYRDLLGWDVADGEPGAFLPFAWQAGGPTAGAIADIAGRSGVHPHWLFFFDVDALEPAMAATREGGGVTVEPVVLPDGRRACVCDDPQGAAFGLRERALTG